MRTDTSNGLETALRGLRASERRFRSLVQNAADMIALCDADATVRYISPSVLIALGYTAAAVEGQSLFTFVHPDDVERVAAFLDDLATSPRLVGRLDWRAQRRDGDWASLEAVCTNLLDEPSVRGIVLNARDVTGQKAREAALHRNAFYDDLTGLPNRLLFTDRLEQAHARALRSGAVVAVLLVDIDRFSEYNAIYGLSVGDRLLIEVAGRLAASVRGVDTVCRVGGDEFAIILEEVAGSSGSRHAAERVIDAFRKPFPVVEQALAVSASVGIGLGEAGCFGPSELLQRADVALHQAKTEGRASFVVYDDRVDSRTLERLRFEGDLRRSLDQGDLRVHYQPEVDLTTGDVVAVEALVRWQHPDRGLIAPREFIPFAEETGLILMIGRWVLREACRQAAAWQTLSTRSSPLIMGVNLSARELADPTLVQDVAAVLQETGLSPAALRLEITESAVMEDAERSIQTLRALRALGVKLAVDDFGTGYSSLSYLRRFPVTTLKIDREFVSALEADSSAGTIVRAVAALGHGLGMDVTVEGIETSQQLALVKALECDRGQGNYFGEPVSGETMTGFLAAHR